MLNIFLGAAAAIIECRNRPNDVQSTIIKIDGRWIPQSEYGNFQVADGRMVTEGYVNARVADSVTDENSNYDFFVFVFVA